MADVVFFVAAVGAIGGAVGTIAMRNPFYSVLSLVGHLLSLSVLFLLLHAEFVAAAQVIVYAGAVMVLYVFVVAYVGGGQDPISPSQGRSLRGLSAVFGCVLLAEFLIAILGSGLKALDSSGAKIPAAFGRPNEIGALFLTKFLLVFEVASLLLLVAAVGAVILARRRAGLEPPQEDAMSFTEFLGGEPGDRPTAPSITQPITESPEPSEAPVTTEPAPKIWRERPKVAAISRPEDGSAGGDVR